MPQSETGHRKTGYAGPQNLNNQARRAAEFVSNVYAVDGTTGAKAHSCGGRQPRLGGKPRHAT
jgi:hypothetical protein